MIGQAPKMYLTEPRSGAVTSPYDGLGKAFAYVLVPCALLGYGLYAYMVGWGAHHALTGIAGYLAGWGVVLWRISR